MRAKVSTDQRTGDHHAALLPVHRAVHDEGDDRDAVDHAAEHALQSVHRVNVGHPDRRQHGQIHDPQAAAKVSAVDRDDQFKD